MSKVIIVRAGLFGSVAATLCKGYGHDVTIIDAGMEESGSKASGCLTKPSWLEKIKEQGRIGLDVLEGLYTIQTIKLKQKIGSVEVLFIPPEKILCHESVREVVKVVGNGYVKTGGDNKLYEGKVLVAAGVWSDSLVDMPTIRQLTGASLIFEKEIKVPRISYWAPYKQSVSFIIRPGETWFGDGTAILRRNYEAKHLDRTIKHAREHGLKGAPNVIVVGMRPYVTGHSSGYFKRVYKNTWVSTGGAKNGLVLAAYQAYQFLNEMRGG